MSHVPTRPSLSPLDTLRSRFNIGNRKGNVAASEVSKHSISFSHRKLGHGESLFTHVFVAVHADSGFSMNYKVKCDELAETASDMDFKVTRVIQPNWSSMF